MSRLISLSVHAFQMSLLRIFPKITLTNMHTSIFLIMIPKPGSVTIEYEKFGIEI